MKKIITFITLFLFLFSFGQSYATTYIQDDYLLGGNTYTIKFETSFQQNVFETKQINDLVDFYGLLNTTGLTKYVSKYIISGTNLDDISLMKKKLINETLYNSKSFLYFLKKYNNDINFDNYSDFLLNIIDENIPYIDGNNYQTIKLLEQDFNEKFIALPDFDTSSNTDNEQILADTLYNFYKGKLINYDDFSLKFVLGVIEKMNNDRSIYLIRDNYEGNKAKLLDDKNTIIGLINKQYDINIINNFNNLFIEDTSIPIDERIEQDSLDNVEYYFLLRKRDYGGGDVRFLDDISGILDNGQIFNYYNRTFLTDKVDGIYDEILNKIEDLNTYETSNLGDNYDEETNELILGITEDGGVINDSDNQIISNEDPILDEIDDISTIDDALFETLYSQELSLLTNRDLSYLNSNIDYNNEQELFITQTITDSNLIDGLLTSSNLVLGNTLAIELENELNSKSLDQIISDNINVTYDVNTEETKDIFYKLSKKQLALNMNNPILGSKYIIQPISSIVLDDNSYIQSLEDNDYEGFLENYRLKYNIDNVAGAYDTDLTGNSGLSNISFSYTPSPIVIKDSLGKNIGIELGSKKTYYLNNDYEITLTPGDYKINIYGINDKFDNLKVFFNNKSLDINGLLDIPSNTGININYLDKKKETNFLPTLWINSVIK